MSLGTITLRRESGPEVRVLARTEMAVLWMPSEVEGRESDCEISLAFEAPDRPISGETSPAGFTRVSGEIRIRTEGFVEEQLVGSRFSIPKGYDTEADEYLTNFYHFDHLQLDEVTVQVLELNEGRYRIVITGWCELDTYGRTAPKSEVVVDGWFDWSTGE